MPNAESSQTESWQGVIRWGGLSLFLAALILVLFIVLVVVAGQTLPIPAEEALNDPTGPTRLFAVTALGEFLLMPGALALFFALRPASPTWALIASACWFVVVPLFLTARGLILALAPLSATYLGTTDPVMQAALLAAAELALHVEDSFATMALLLLSASSVIMGIVMTRGVMGKPLGYLTIVAGALSLFAPFVVDTLPVVTFAGLGLSAIWQLIAGIRLFRMGAPAPA